MYRNLKQDVHCLCSILKAERASFVSIRMQLAVGFVNSDVTYQFFEPHE